MRSNIELLDILIESLEKGNKSGYFNNGICGEIEDLRKLNIITEIERRHLSDIILANKPSVNNKYAIFTKSIYWKEYSKTWWWDLMRYESETRQIRIDYLKELKKNIQKIELN